MLGRNSQVSVSVPNPLRPLLRLYVIRTVFPHQYIRPNHLSRLLDRSMLVDYLLRYPALLVYWSRDLRHYRSIHHHLALRHSPKVRLRHHHLLPLVNVIHIPGQILYQCQTLNWADLNHIPSFLLRLVSPPHPYHPIRLYLKDRQK